MPIHSEVRKISFRFGIIFFALTGSSGLAQTNLQYQQPPKAIVDIVDALPTPGVELSPAGSATAKRWMLIEHFSGLPTIAELAQPELRLAGLRFNPRTDGPSRGRYDTSLELQALPNGKAVPVSGLPEHAKMRFADWSPDGRKISFVNISDAKEDAGLSLWIVDVETAQARRLPGIALNGIFGSPCEWLSDSQGLVCRTVPAERGAAPVRSEVPTGPVVQENLGRVTPGATFEDLLKNPEDEQFFDYYAKSQIAIVRLDGGSVLLGKAGVFVESTPSPDGKWVLLFERHHPYTYLLPFYAFPERVSAVNLKTGTAKQLVDKPLEDNIPNIHDAVAPGPRDHEWRSDAPASVFWVEAGDGGDPRKDAAVRDTLFLLDAPFESAPRKLAELPVRYRRVAWGNDHLALVEELRWKDRKRVILAVAPSAPATPVKLFEGSFEDRYHDPGTAVEEYNSAGKPVIQTTADGKGIYFKGEGASAEGDKPFLSVMSAANGDAKRLWQSVAPYFEIAAAVLDPAAGTILIRRESQEQSPNYYIQKIGSASAEQVTFFPNPYGTGPLPKKQVLHYKRSDGVDLSANLYLPPGYKPSDGPLPALMEAYPTEYKTKSAAGQVTGSPYQFTFLILGIAGTFCDAGLCGARKRHNSDHWRRQCGAERYLCGTACGQRQSGD